MYHVHRLYKRKKKKLPSALREHFETLLHSLHNALRAKDKELSNKLAKEAEHLAKLHLPKTIFEQTFDLIFALAFALVVAMAIRQMWFEFYVIPTGSMRPTLKEQDYLVVSKNDFGINTPLRTSHFYFDQKLIKRGSVVIFSGENMDIRDVDTTYFFLIPGKKQFVKRLIGKPGDTLYFYGGLLYGVDSEGNEIKDFRQNPWFEKIEHIPFIQFEGKVMTSNLPVAGIFSPALLYQMNEPVAKLFMTPYGQPGGEMLVPKVSRYGDLWGFKHFGMATLVSEKELKEWGLSTSLSAPLYLKIAHHPTFQPARLVKDEYGRMRPALSYTNSVVPLTEEHLKEIASHLYTSRFVAKKGLLYRYGVDAKYAETYPYQPKLSGIPDGTYEFQDGIAYKILGAGHFLGGYAKKLPSTHPLYELNVERLQLFYNLGIEFDTHFSPVNSRQLFAPARYAYFRKGDLYLMGYPILKKEDSTLQAFLAQEKAGIDLPFIDLGPPVKNDGTLDKDLILQYGVRIPEKMYLCLGDNHAMSADSRVFGFVPEQNLRGKARLIFWPPSSRWGFLPQPRSYWFTTPHFVIWIAFFAISGAAIFYYRRRFRQPLKF